MVAEGRLCAVGGPQELFGSRARRGRSAWKRSPATSRPFPHRVRPRPRKYSLKSLLYSCHCWSSGLRLRLQTTCCEGANTRVSPFNLPKILTVARFACNWHLPYLINRTTLVRRPFWTQDLQLSL